jgi:probable HAF family extracellular repeat protein
MQDLGTLPGDVTSGALGMNNKGQVVGGSNDPNGNGRAVLWQDGVMTDLNSLIPQGSSLYLVYAGDINDDGEIVGLAFDPSTGTFPAFLAIPCDEKHAALEALSGAAFMAQPQLGEIIGMPRATNRSPGLHLLNQSKTPWWKRGKL